MKSHSCLHPLKEEFPPKHRMLCCFLICSYTWLPASWCCCFICIMTPFVASTIQNQWDLWTGWRCLSGSRMPWGTFGENSSWLIKLLRPHIMVGFGCNKCVGSVDHFHPSPCVDSSLTQISVTVLPSQSICWPLWNPQCPYWMFPPSLCTEEKYTWLILPLFTSLIIKIKREFFMLPKTLPDHHFSIFLRVHVEYASLTLVLTHCRFYLLDHTLSMYSMFCHEATCIA